MKQQNSPTTSGDEFSLESILAEFSTSGTKKKSAEPKTEPKKEPKVESKTEPKKEPVSSATIAVPVMHAEPVAAKTEKPAKEPTTVVNLPKIMPLEPKPEEPAAKSDNVTPIRRVARTDVKAEDLAMPHMDPDTEVVIDTGAFDTVYEKKQRRIKKLKQQMIAVDKQERKANARANRKKLRPSHIKTGPIPISPDTKAELEKGKKQGFIRLVPRPKKEAKPAEEKAKPLLNPLHMLKKIEKNKKSTSIRFWMALVACAALFYMTAASYLKLPIMPELLLTENAQIHAAVSGGLLALVLLCGYDILARGLAGLVMLRIGGDTLVSSSALVSLAYCVVTAMSPEIVLNASGTAVYAPVAMIPAIAVVFSLWGIKTRNKVYFRSLRSCYRLKHAKTLTTLPDRYDGDVMYAATKTASQQGFYQTLTEGDASVTTMRWYAPIVLAASLFLAVYCGYSTADAAPFLWCWSLILSLTPAVGFAVASVLPLARVAKRLYRDGVLLGGGKSLARMGARSFVMLTDEDIFPGDSITINGYKLMDPEKKELALSAAASILDAANTSLAKPFMRIASDSFAPIRPVKELVFSDAGGMTGMIDGHHVMVGTASFVQRAHIKIPPDIKLRTAVFCVVDSELLAIFAVKYQVTPKADYALNLLEDNGYMPVVATRDFNVTASFIQSRFGISSADVVYPPADMRVSLSDPTLELEASGLIVTYGGSDAVANALISCRRYRSATRLSLLFSLLSSIFGLGLCALMTFFGWAQVATPVNLLIYYLLWAVPPFVFAGWVGRF
ncbi:MAG: hypothetical protein IKU55_05745 [Clostridia bacterium]|nr:hypothetical protein [Clostridia bacterium]